MTERPAQMSGVFCYRPKRLAFALVGVLFGVFALFCAAIVWWRFPFRDGFVFADGLFIVAVFLFALLSWAGAVTCLGNKVALRIDAVGVSGNHLPDLVWGDIAEIGSVYAGRYAAIGLVLHDPGPVLSRRPLWEKIKGFHLTRRYHLLIGTAPLAGSRDEILSRMRGFWAASRD